MSFDDETITINIEKLRKDMLNESYGAFAGGGFGGALMQALDLEKHRTKKWPGLLCSPA